VIGGGRTRVQLRTVLSDHDRALRIRGLLIAMAACGALVVAVIAVGLAVDWPLWVVSLAALLPLAEGLVAARAAYVLHRQRAAPTPD
jgi:hypothetical protein